MKTEIVIWPYQEDDFPACMQIMQENIPAHFDASEAPDFASYLKSYAAGSYWIIARNTEIVGCGGIRVCKNEGRLVYGMISPRYHRNGLGSVLLDYRLELLFNRPDIEVVTIDTTQKSEGFFCRHGFNVASRTPNGYGSNLDLVTMSRKRPPNRDAQLS
jgi:ribosomal protein S18 acetylase RimI-like enzyme